MQSASLTYTPHVRRVLIAVVSVLITGVSLTAAACEPDSGGITTDLVRLATVTEVVDVPASVTAKAAATLSAPADGTITKLTVAPGDAVKAGDVVAVVDSPAARKRLADAKAALAAAKRIGVSGGTVDLSGVQAGLDAAAADAFESAEQAAGLISDEEVRAAMLAEVEASRKHYEAAAKVSRSVVRQVQQGLAGISDAVGALGTAQRIQARSAYDLAKAAVDALTIRAPIGGVVQLARPAAGVSADGLAGLLGGMTGGPALAGAGGAGGAGGNADGDLAGVDDVLAVGDRITAGTPILTIVDVSEISLVGEVDETDVLLVEPGVPAAVELDAAPGVVYGATVRSVDLLPTPSARGGVAYRIRLTFAEASDDRPTPRPGMSAVAHLSVRTAVEAVAVPAASVFTVDGGDAVWVVRDGVAVQQRVEVGVQGEDLVEIRSGVAPGDTIVVGGADRVSAGQDLS